MVIDIQFSHHDHGLNRVVEEVEDPGTTMELVLALKIFTMQD